MSYLLTLSVGKKVCQAFGLLVHRVVKFTVEFKCSIRSVPLSVAILNRALYQPGKAGLKNYIIS